MNNKGHRTRQNKFAFYLLGRRAFDSLQHFFTQIGPKSVAWVIIGKDAGVANDYYHEISDLCNRHSVAWCDRLTSPEDMPSADIRFAIGWKWIIRDCHDLVILHDSLLPRYRGFSPLVAALCNGDTRVGVTAIRAENQYDTGEILGQKSIELSYPVTIKQAIDRTSILYQELIIDVVDCYCKNDVLVGSPQDESEVTYSLWRDEDDYLIDWNQTSDKIERFINAVGEPYAGALTRVNNILLRVLAAEVVPDVKIESRSSHVGKIIFNDSNHVVIVCGSGLLRLLRVVDAQTGEQFKFKLRSRLV